MRRPLAPEDAKLWSLVTATVRPTGGRKAEVTHVVAPDDGTKTKMASKKSAPPKVVQSDVLKPSAPPPQPVSFPTRMTAPEDIEPRRRRRISRSREPIGARLDLHGMDQARAQLAVSEFVRRAYQDGMRAVLIITGKGTLGDGILRRRAPDWLSDPGIRPMIAGFSLADRHHGGEGALYVALKRSGR